MQQQRDFDLARLTPGPADLLFSPCADFLLRSFRYSRGYIAAMPELAAAAEENEIEKHTAFSWTSVRCIERGEIVF